MIRPMIIALILSSTAVFSQTETSSVKKSGVKYTGQGRVDFESLLIEGERKKPEMSVVTGNLGEKDSGLLKFRQNFLDTMADDFGESVQ